MPGMAAGPATAARFADPASPTGPTRNVNQCHEKDRRSPGGKDGKYAAGRSPQVRARTPPWKGAHRARTVPVSWLEAEPPAFPVRAVARQWHRGRSVPPAPRASRAALAVASYSGGAAPAFHRTSGRLRSRYVSGTLAARARRGKRRDSGGRAAEGVSETCGKRVTTGAVPRRRAGIARYSAHPPRCSRQM
jgi:hypothetical protein